MHTTRSLILAAVLTLMGDGITTSRPVEVIPDDTETPTAAVPAVPADPAALAPPTEAETAGAALWFTEVILAVLLVPVLAGANPIIDCGSGKIGCAPVGVWTGTFRGKPLKCCVIDHRCDAAFPNALPLEGQCILGKQKRRIIQLYAGGNGLLCHGVKRKRPPCCAFTAPSSSGGAFVGAAECKNVLNVPLSLQPN